MRRPPRRPAGNMSSWPSTRRTLSEQQPPHAAARNPRRRHPPIYYWGVFILVVGLATAALVYAFAREDPDLEAQREIASGRAYQHNVELMGGKFALLSTEFDQWFASLWRGRSLAYTVGVLSVAIAGACFLIAHLTSAPPPSDTGRARANVANPEE